MLDPDDIAKLSEFFGPLSVDGDSISFFKPGKQLRLSFFTHTISEKTESTEVSVELLTHDIGVEERKIIDAALAFGAIEVGDKGLIIPQGRFVEFVAQAARAAVNQMATELAQTAVADQAVAIDEMRKATEA